MGETQRSSEIRGSKNSPASLADTRSRGRLFGSLSFSMLTHIAFIAALFMSPAQSNKILEIGGDGSVTAGSSGSSDGSVSMIENQGDSADAVTTTTTGAMAGAIEVTDTPAKTMTDETSDVVASKVELAAQPVPVTPPKPKVETVTKPVAKPKTAVPRVKPARVVSQPIVTSKEMTSDETDVPVVDPSTNDDANDKTAEEPVVTVTAPAKKAEEKHEELAPTLLANPPSDDEPTPKAETAPVSSVHKAEPVREESEEPARETKPVAAVVPVTDHGSERGSSNESHAATSKTGTASDGSQNGAASGAGTTTAAAGSEGNGSGTGDDSATAGGVIGPIRDASDLKALPGNPNPVYPARDRLSRKEGTAVILGHVSPDGRITEMKLEKSSGSQAMDSASLQAFRSWRFQAGQQGWVRKPFQFRLVGEATEVPANPLGKGLKR